MCSNKYRHHVPPERLCHLGDVCSKPFQHTRGQLAANSLCKLDTKMIIYFIIYGYPLGPIYLAPFGFQTSNVNNTIF